MKKQLKNRKNELYQRLHATAKNHFRGNVSTHVKGWKFTVSTTDKLDKAEKWRCLDNLTYEAEQIFGHSLVNAKMKGDKYVIKIKKR